VIDDGMVSGCHICRSKTKCVINVHPTINDLTT
jgi:hypothetical protein